MYINQPNSPYHGMQLDVMRDYFDNSVIVCINNQEVIFSKKFLSEVHPSKIVKPRVRKTVEKKVEETKEMPKTFEDMLKDLEIVVRKLDDDNLAKMCDIVSKEYFIRILSKR